MIITTILFGLVGLGIVVFVHELGHFVAAKLVGVKVETFSLGWGPRIVGFKRGDTDYRLSLLPIGGFCAMKGEDAFRKALEEKLPEIPREEGSYFAASPARRIIIALAGPLFNVIFAALVFTAVYAIGVRYTTVEPRIVLASEYPEAVSGSANATSSGVPAIANAADAAGMKTGDRVVELDGKPVDSFSKLQEIVALSAGKSMTAIVERKGVPLSLSLTPKLDKKHGIGIIGVYAWVNPVVAKVAEGSAAAFADIRPGDRIVSVGGKPAIHSRDIALSLRDSASSIALGIERDGAIIEKRLVLHDDAKGRHDIGVTFASIAKIDREPNLPAAIVRGLSETWRTFTITLKGLATLFAGVDVLSAVSGPARITYMVGEVATQGFETSLTDGLVSAFNFLSLLSIGLFIMNLLPIPVVDGGQIVLFLIEAIKRRPLRVKTMYRYQFVGMVLILGIFLMSTLADFLFFTTR